MYYIGYLHIIIRLKYLLETADEQCNTEHVFYYEAGDCYGGYLNWI